MPTGSLLDQARTQFARKPVRYALVSVVAVVTSQAVLITCNGPLGWEPVPSNVTAVAVSSIPSYLLNRAWVWGKRGGHHLGREVLPFWVMGFLGLALSTLLVGLAARWSEATPVISAANLSAFGLLWVGKYFVLDTVLFGGHHPELEDDDELLFAPTSSPTSAQE